MDASSKIVAVFAVVTGAVILWSTVQIIKLSGDITYKYIKTPYGLISYSRGYCELGMLISNDGKNIRDKNDNPISCEGYVNLTRKQAKAQEKTNETN